MEPAGRKLTGAREGGEQAMERAGATGRSGTHGGTTGEVWTTRRLLGWMSEHFKSKGVDSPRVMAEMLIAHVLKCERLKLYMEADRPASAPELSVLRELTARAAKHEPVQYLTGSAWFFSREFEVDRTTLIPRPSTETLVQMVIEWAATLSGTFRLRGRLVEEQDCRRAAMRIADIGTGTGCVGITLALQFPDARVTATDIVAGALELAKRNAQRHGVLERLEFVEGDMVEGLKAWAQGEAKATQGEEGDWAGMFDVIVSNPPYISDAEWETVARNVKEYEPASALRGGGDGLFYVRKMIAEGPAMLREGGLLAVEIAHWQREEVLKMAEQSGMLRNVRVVKDQEGLWRVVVGERV